MNFSIKEAIKYVGLGAILFFLIRGFDQEAHFSNQHVFILVMIILFLLFFISSDRESCPRTKESFKPTLGKFVDLGNPLSDSDNIIDPYAGYLPEDVDYELPAQYAQNLNRSIEDMGVDPEEYDNIKQNEKTAMNKIKSNYQDEMLFTKTHPFNTVALGANIHGYTYLPPANWFRAYERPPVCIAEQIAPVHPIHPRSVEGLLQFDSRNNLTNPNNINLRYAKRRQTRWVNKNDFR